MPTAALDTDAETVIALSRAGLKTLDHLAERPSETLSARFGEELATKLRRILGHDAVELYVRQNGINGFYATRDARKSCCDIRKVEPLGRALAGADIWLTGLRADQSAARSGVLLAEADASRGLVKASPLIDWTRERALAFAEENAVPINPLHAEGFVSIGCQPCTRAIRPGEPERAGRWWWEDDAAKECGLHGDTPGSAATLRRPGSFGPESW